MERSQSLVLPEEDVAVTVVAAAEAVVAEEAVEAEEAVVAVIEPKS